MKRAFQALAWVLVAGLAGLLAVGQGTRATETGPSRSDLRVAEALPRLFELPVPAVGLGRWGGDEPVSGFKAAGEPGLKVLSTPVAPLAAPALWTHPLVVVPGPSGVILAQKRSEAVPLQPGVYASRPYTCLIIVPGPHPDDGSCIAPDTSRFNMPMLKPDLRLIPHPAAQPPAGVVLAPGGRRK